MFSTPPTSLLTVGQSAGGAVELVTGLAAADAADFTASLAALVASDAALVAVSVVSFTVFVTVSVTFLVVSVRVEDVSFVTDAEADGVGVALPCEPEPPERTPSIAFPMVPSSPPPEEADGDGVDVPLPVELPDALAEDPDGDGVALSSEPESDEEALPLSDVLSEDAEGVGVGVSADLDALAEADGDGEDDASLEPSWASTHFWYSSAVRLLAGEWSSARASVELTPIPMKTAVGIAARAMALPAGMWNLVNSGFLGAAWRGPVLARDASTSAPWVTSSAGTMPPVRPVGRARS
jgi:hypothetical protein